jgi:hypothetical protein
VQRDGALTAALLGERRHEVIDGPAGKVERRNVSSQGSNSPARKPPSRNHKGEEDWGNRRSTRGGSRHRRHRLRYDLTKVAE